MTHSHDEQTSNAQVFTLVPQDAEYDAKQKETLLEMVTLLREQVESGRVKSIALVAELDGDEIYSDYYGGFNPTLLGGVAYLQSRMADQ